MTATLHEEVTAWLAGRLPDGWFTGPPEVTVDPDEILVVGALEAPVLETKKPRAEERSAAEAARIARFREETRERRMTVADEAQRRFGRTVSWGATCGETRRVFTNLSVPVMTRLRLAERRVLDTLVESGVARSRSEALGWCVRLVAEHEADWLRDLQDALVHVQRVRAEGPRSL